MTLPENTNYEAFTKFLEQECMHETVYDDSEGRRILVVRVLDAFTMAHRWGARMVRDEREAMIKAPIDQGFVARALVLAEREKCAQLVETYQKAGNTMGAPEYVMVFKDCAAAIRARGAHELRTF